MLEVTVGGLTFTGSDDVHDETSAFIISPDGFTGWDGSVGLRRSSQDRPLSHGVTDAPGFLGARSVLIAGQCITPSQAATELMGERLTGLLADGSSDTVTVSRLTGVQRAVGRLVDSSFEPRPYAPDTADYELQLWFPDPRKYGKAREFRSGGDGRWTAYQRGNFPAASTITVVGNAPSYTVGGPGEKKFKVGAVLQPGSPHTINLATGQVTIRGQVKFGVVSVADTWPIAPRQLIDHRIVADGGGTAQATHAVEDTYI